MDTAIFEKLGLHQTLGWDDEINGHRNTDLVGQMVSPGDAGYHPCAEAFPDTDVPSGAVTELLDWSESTIFPGTKRNIYFYKPDQLDRTTEAPGLIVFLDGPAFLAPAGPIRAAAVLDTQNHRGDIPVTAAVFVTPGRPLDQPSVHEEPPGSPVANRVAVAQRSLEYDRLTNDFPRFLTDELLPLGEEALGFQLNPEPARRAVCGFSSGGIAAFNAAWHRPEVFGSVISSGGAFINIEGGHNYPYLVRTTARKPIQVWLQTGQDDGDIPWGSIPLGNQQMASALEFAGYRVRFEFGSGGHSPRHAGALFAETLRWLWGGRED